MTTSRILTSFIFSVLLSCNNVETKSKSETVITDTSHKKPKIENKTIVSDTIKRFVVDDYPITDNMFGRDINGREINSGKLRSLDKVWFSNDTLRQILIIELYTDNHRMLTYHFYNNNIPTELIKRIEFNVEGGDTASNAQKLKDFSGFLSKTQKINSNYFTTDKGIKLGDNIDKVLKIYDKPDKIETTNGIEEYYWEFIGDILYDGKTDLKGKPLAKDNFGHQTTMFFKNKKLIGLIFHNDIP